MPRAAVALKEEQRTNGGGKSPGNELSDSGAARQGGVGEGKREGAWVGVEEKDGRRSSGLGLLAAVGW